jgi:hypothetical protein
MFNIKVLATRFGCGQPSSGRIYIHLVDLHNEYLCDMESHVALQYFGNVYNECRYIYIYNEWTLIMLPKYCNASWDPIAHKYSLCKSPK